MLYFWLSVIVIAIIVEIIVPGLVSIWFVPSALIAMLLECFNVPIAVQIILFLILSAVFIFLARKFFKPKKDSKTNIDSLIGEKCVVTENIDNIHNSGKVKLRGMDWTARSTDENLTFEVGEIVVVSAIEGVKLIVEKNN